MEQGTYQRILQQHTNGHEHNLLMAIFLAFVVLSQYENTLTPVSTHTVTVTHKLHMLDYNKHGEY